MATTELMPVEFAGSTLYILNHENAPYVPMRPIVEGIGLAWQSQLEKLKGNDRRFCITEIVTQMPGDDQTRNVCCIPLRKLPGWMMTIYPNKVKDVAVREKVIAYQNECDDVLWDYWNKATVQPLPQPESSLAPYSVLPNQTLSEDQAQTLRAMLDDFVKTLPKEKQGGFMVKGWAKLKAHFNVGYREIPAEKFTDAVSIIARHIVEYSAPALEAPKQAELDLSTFSLVGVRLLISHDHTGRELIQRVPGDAMLATWDDVANIMLDQFLMPSMKQLVAIMNAAAVAIAKRSGFGKSEPVTA